MGLPEILKDLWLKTLGGTAPTGAASQTGDLSQMVKYMATAGTRAWTPFGLVYPYYGAGADTVISVNTNTDAPFKQYRDLTINSGIVLSAIYSPQIIVCRTLAFGNTAAQISANGLGGAGGTGAVNGGHGGITDTAIAGAATTGQEAILESLMAAGGGGGVGVAGSAATTRALGAALTLALLGMGVRGGGGGGGNYTGAGSGAGGTRGGAGADAGIIGGGGSGIGGGGGSSGGVANAANGGPGGGVLIVLCDDIITAAGLITANGSNGASGTGGVGGGGGGGGLVLVFARTCTVTPTIQANGGTHGGSTYPAGDGGAGIAQLVRST